MKARGFFFLLMVFTISCFAWWTLQLEQLNRHKIAMEEEIVYLKVEQASNAILWLGAHDSSGINPIPMRVGTLKVFVSEKSIEQVKSRYPQLEFNYVSGYMVIQPAPIVLNGLHSDISKTVIRQIVEGVLFLSLLLIGFVWIYRGLNRALRLSRQQSEFLVSITHELKTPIATSRLLYETMLRPGISKEQQESLCRKGIENHHNQLQLIESLIAASELDNGNSLFNKKEIPLSEWMEEEIRRIQLEYNHSLNILADIEEGISVLLDENSWRLSMQNLIANAYKYGGQAGSIFITLKKKDSNWVLLSIGDEGPGIPDSDKKKVFKKFFRCGDALTRQQRGTGLGLFIVSETMKYHKGKVWIEDRAPHGALFNLLIKAV